MQSHWTECTGMNDLWKSTLQRALLRLRIQIQIKVDEEAKFDNLLCTFDHLSTVDFAGLKLDLMRGKILSSDLCGIICRISTKQTLNYNNLGTTFLKYLFHAFCNIIWADHNKRMNEWEEIQ